MGMLAFLALGVVVACTTPPPTSPAADPAIESFGVAPSQVSLGETVTLEWEASGTTGEHVCVLYIARPGSTSSDEEFVVGCTSLRVDTPNGVGDHRYSIQIESKARDEVFDTEVAVVLASDVQLAWRAMGPPLSHFPENTRATRSSLVFDDNDVPHVAWYESTIPAEEPGSVDVVLVKRWTGSTWELLGAPLSAYSGDTDATWPSMGVGSDGDPIVAFAEQDIHVWRWTGTFWSAMGAPLSALAGDTEAHTPSLAVDTAGKAAVAWTEDDGVARHVYVAVWNGAAWEQLGAAISTNNGVKESDRPSVAIDASGTPTVAWSELDGSGMERVHVARWNGSIWQSLGGELSAYPGDTKAKGAWLAMDADGSTFVAWYEHDGAAEYVHVSEWNGVSWESLGSRLSVSGGADDSSWPSLEIAPSGRPIVAWRDEDVHVWQWDGAAWNAIGTPLSAFPGSTRAFRPSVAIDSIGRPAVSWHENDGTTDDIHVWRFGP